MKKDEQSPALEEGQEIAFNGATCTKDQTKPPARYSAGPPYPGNGKAWPGTKSTRHSIIERLYTVKYVQNDPIEPSQLGMAVCDALDKFAPHITHSEMTAGLEAEMDNIAEGQKTKTEVVTNSRNLLSEQLARPLPHSEEVKDALADAVAADAYVGPCPKCAVRICSCALRRKRAQCSSAVQVGPIATSPIRCLRARSRRWKRSALFAACPRSRSRHSAPSRAFCASTQNAKQTKSPTWKWVFAPRVRKRA